MAEQTVKLHNECLAVEISTRGAEIQSVRGADGEEYIWQGDASVWWKGRAPLLFPICGGLKDDAYTLNGQSYHLEKHGYIRFQHFTVEEQAANRLVLLHTSTDETKKQYPFDYAFRAVFELDGAELTVTYSVQNLSADTMYFSVGAHEAYATPGGLEEYSIVFEKPVTLYHTPLTGNYLSEEQVCILENGTELPLKYDYFAVDALVFKNANLGKARLVRRGGGTRAEIDFPDFPHLLLWMIPKADYICIEPWMGIPDGVDEGGELSAKKSITALCAGGQYRAAHKIRFGMSER